MKMRNALKFGMIFAAVAVAFFGMFLEQASASEMKMRQQILPVRFVYLDKNGSVDHVWSNVSEKDSEYVVKFFDKKTDKEIFSEEKMLKNYQDFVLKNQVIEPELKKGLVAIDCGRSNLVVNFIQTRGGDKLEEVHTYL